MKNTPQWFRTNFSKHFPDIDPGEIICLTLVGLGRGCHIDVLKLEEKLESIHGKIPDGVSMADCVAEHYGNDAVEWVREAL